MDGLIAAVEVLVQERRRLSGVKQILLKIVVLGFLSIAIGSACAVGALRWSQGGGGPYKCEHPARHYESHSKAAINRHIHIHD